MKLQRPQDLSIPPETLTFLERFPGKQLFMTLDPVQHFAGAIQDVWPKIQDKNAFLCVNEMPNNKRDKESDITCRAVWVEDDEPRDTPRSDFPLQPSIVVRSSSRKWHYYWVTKTTDKDAWNQVMQTMVMVHGCDKAAKDISRVLRLPGTKNHKYTPPQECKLHKSNGNMYPWLSIKEAFKPVPVSIPIERKKQKFEETEQKRQFLTCEHVTFPVNGYIMHLAHHRYSRKDIEDRVTQWFDEIPSEVKSIPENSLRYMEARKQIGKWITSAILKTDTAAPDDAPPDIIPDALELDYSKYRPIPKECIPPVMYEAAKEIGDWSSVGPDPSILSAVFIASAAINRKAEIQEIGTDHTTFCQCGIMIAMTTGSRKSSIYEQTNKPYFDATDIKQKEWEDNKHINKSKISMLNTQLKTLQKQEKKVQSGIDSAEFLAMATAQGAILSAIELLEAPKPVDYCSDVTEERLVRILHENRGRIAIISDDARQLVRNLRGNYKQPGQTGESVYINGFTGSSITYERVSSDPIYIRRPCLNALLFVQTDAALDLLDSEMYVPSGLAARMPIYFYPVSGVQILRSTKRRRIDQTKMQPYYDALQSLCIRRKAEEPMQVTLNDTKIHRCDAMSQEMADIIQFKWGEAAYDKVNKIITTTLIYATCFAALDDPKFDLQQETYELPMRYINQAFIFAKHLFSQSLLSSVALAEHCIPDYAQRVLTYLEKAYEVKKMYEGFVPQGDFINSFNHSWRDAVPAAVDLLLAKGYLYETIWTKAPRKLNGGFPNKIIHPGDKVLHLNTSGIQKRLHMKQNSLETVTRKEIK